jgi:hypothetical protein
MCEQPALAMLHKPGLQQYQPLRSKCMSSLLRLQPAAGSNICRILRQYAAAAAIATGLETVAKRSQLLPPNPLLLLKKLPVRS